jgi:hypothetical protein
VAAGAEKIKSIRKTGSRRRMQQQQQTSGNHRYNRVAAERKQLWINAGLEKPLGYVKVHAALLDKGNHGYRHFLPGFVERQAPIQTHGAIREL